MVKNLRYFFALLLMMVAGVTWAGTVDDVLTANDFTATSSTYSNFSGVTKNSGAKYAGNTAKDASTAVVCIQMRSNNSNSGIVSTTSGGKITKVTIAWSSKTADARKLQVYGSNTAYTQATVLYDTDKQGTLLGTLNKDDNETVVEVDGDYAYVGIRSYSGALYLESVTFTWDDGINEDPDKKDAAFSFGEVTTFEVNQNSDGTFPTFVAPTLNKADGFDGTVVYSSTNEEVAEVDEETGAVTIVGVGETTIKAYAEATDNFNADQASYKITVNKYVDPNAPGGKNNPYTVAQARAAIDAGEGVTEVYAKGVVSDIVTAYSSTYGNITYNISEDGTTDADQLQSYRGKSYNGENFTSEDDIQVGDEVVIFGNLTKYGTTYEFAANNQLVSLNRPDVPVKTNVAIVNSLTPTTLTVGDEGKFVADVNVADGVGDDDYEVTFASSDDDVLTVLTDGTYEAVAKGTVNITVHVEAIDEENFNNVDKVFTVTVKAPAAPAATGDYKLVTSTDDVEEGQYLIVYEEIAMNGSLGTGIDKTNNYIGVAKSENFIVATDDANAASFNITAVEGGYAIATQDGTVIGQKSNANGLETGDGLVNTIEITEKGDADIVSAGAHLRYNAASNQERFRYYMSSSYINQKAVYLYKRVNETAPAVTFDVEISDAGYATLYYGASNIVVPTGVEAYTYTVKEGVLEESKIYQAGKVIPAGTGVVLKAAAGTYTFEATTEVAEADEDNMLKGSDGGFQDKTEGYKYYILSYDAQGKNVGFYFQVEGGASVTNAAHKAYLAVPEANAGEAKFFVFGGETGINTVEAGMTSGVVYNLQGQRVENAQKGIFIVNGKKVVR